MPEKRQTSQGYIIRILQHFAITETINLNHSKSLELRYYTKIVDKEKEVLLNFIKATKEYPALRQPHYRINLTPTQTKLRKNVGTRKKRKSKKHASRKTKGKTNEDGDQENTSHYVSKIVVDDATHCLKLRVRSCKKSQELKENNSSVPPERARSRKAKQPRRYTRSLESLTENINGDGMENPKVVRDDDPIQTQLCLQ
jgi:hypothetical protein